MHDYLRYDTLEAAWAANILGTQRNNELKGYAAGTSAEASGSGCEPRVVALRRHWSAFICELKKRTEKAKKPLRSVSGKDSVTATGLLSGHQLLQEVSDTCAQLHRVLEPVFGKIALPDAQNAVLAQPAVLRQLKRIDGRFHELRRELSHVIDV